MTVQPMLDVSSCHEDSKDSRVTRTSASPTRPSYSPFTPTLSDANLSPPGPFELGPDDEAADLSPRWIDEPPSHFLDMDENSDAIALRAAISILQTQRSQCLQDLKDLEALKKIATADPQAFLHEIQPGQPATTSSSETDQTDSTKAGSKPKGLSTIPSPQDVIRCPPMEWSKYHIVGHPLEDMHYSRKTNPTSSDIEDDRKDNSNQPPYVVAAPYRPFTDLIDDKTASGDESTPT